MAVSVDAIALRLRRLGRMSYRTPRIRQALERAATEAAVVARRRAPRRDGYLRASIFGEVDGPDVVVGSTERYADLHERGGVVRPRRGRWLTIPLLGQRGGARQDRTPMFFFRAKSGKAFLAERIGKRIRVRWRLREQTTAPARRFLAAGGDAAMDRMRTLLVVEYVDAMED